MVQQVPEEDAAATAAALPNPLSLGQHSMLNPRPPSPSIGPIFDEPDTIERLNNVPTPCSIITGCYSTLLIELAQGIVQSGDMECHTVPVQDGYVVVKIDFVHENAKDVALPIPLPEADIYTLGDARTMRIQWKKVVFSSPHWSVVN